MTDPAKTRSPADSRPPINEQWLTRMRSTKPDFLAQLFEVFLEDEPGRITTLGQAVCDGNLETVRYLAHSIKGAAATLGMERLCDAARMLEHAAKDGGDADTLAVQYTVVLAEMEKVYEVIQNGKRTA